MDSMEERRQGFLDLQDDVKEIKTDIKIIMHILNGNGEKGLVAKVQDHQEAIAAQKKVMAHAGLSLIGAIIVSAVGFVAVKLGFKQ